MSHYPTVTPHLANTDVAAAIDFYTAAFGARERLRLSGRTARSRTPR